jgi:hypothetical protein
VTADVGTPGPPRVAGALELEVPGEPAALRVTMHEAVEGGQGWDEAFGDGAGVGAMLWGRWGAALEQAGVGRAQFDAVVRGYRRELWFWFLGERTWQQAAEGLAGRLRRRLPEG